MRTQLHRIEDKTICKKITIIIGKDNKFHRKNTCASNIAENFKKIPRFL